MGDSYDPASISIICLYSNPGHDGPTVELGEGLPFVKRNDSPPSDLKPWIDSSLAGLPFPFVWIQSHFPLRPFLLAITWKGQLPKHTQMV